jgi:hypothetical protein
LAIKTKLLNVFILLHLLRIEKRFCGEKRPNNSYLNLTLFLNEKKGKRYDSGASMFRLLTTIFLITNLKLFFHPDKFAEITYIISATGGGGSGLRFGIASAAEPGSV